jgi:hypothetical protein
MSGRPINALELYNRFRNEMSKPDPFRANEVPVDRGFLAPLATYADGQTELALPAFPLGAIWDGVRSFGAQGFDTPEAIQHNAGAAFDTAGAIVQGGLGVGLAGGLADNALGSAGKEAARLTRAKALGFDTDNVWYHGSPHTFDEFEIGPSRVGTGGGDPYQPMSGLGAFFTQDPEIAALYGPNVRQFYVRGEYPEIYNPVANKPEAVDTIEQTTADMRQLLSRGYEGARLTGPGTEPELAVFNPRNIRSVHAAFDPSMSDSANLLAANAKPGAAVPLLQNALERAGADLPMDLASRMARAKEMGFDTETPLYHGTDKKFDEFKIGSEGYNSTILGSEPVKRAAVFLAEDPALAREFADQAGRNGEVMPLMTRTESYFDASKYGFSDLPDSFFEKSGLNRRYYDNLYPEKAWQAFDEEAGGFDFIKALQEAGYDSVKLRDVSSGDVANTNSWAVFDPRNIRSTNAAFDPAKSDSANLLAANAKSGAAVPLLQNALERAQPQGIRGLRLERAGDFSERTPDYTPMELRAMLAATTPRMAKEMVSDGLSVYRRAREYGASFPEALEDAFLTAKDVKREALESWSEQMADAKKGPSTKFSYNILDDAGNNLGDARGEVFGDTMFFDWLGGRPYGDDANTIGVRGVRALREQVRADFPNVKNFQGLRVSGARSGKLLDADNSAMQSVYIPANAPTASAIPLAGEAQDTDPALIEYLRAAGLM